MAVSTCDGDEHAFTSEKNTHSNRMGGPNGMMQMRKLLSGRGMTYDS
jgi:hypothetical protein